ncbi:cation-translocating P-type ATPase [Clostridia bacterium OttesenSCG-928-O13]|nr:cation-translocating P-type ATPase [Clostridia bacterium OttesenSCG-928-O13]
MLKKVNDILAGVPMTVAGGAFLVVSLVLSLTGRPLPVDPAWVAVVICGIPLLYLALFRVAHNPGIKKISSALLISIAMIAAIAIGDIFAAGEVAFIMAIGAILEDKTAERAQKGLRKLIALAPQGGHRLVGGQQEEVRAQDIRVDDILRILPGETVPVDGEIMSGSTSVDQAVITGESLPVDKGPGDAVFCGTVNRFGCIDIRATQVGEDSSLQKLIRMVQEAENQKAPMERIADKWATWLVPVALLIAIVAGLATGDIVRAVTVLVVFCPCALVLATPTAVMAAIGQATKYGVIIKSGAALERMGKVDTIAFDKTGTLTNGNLVVTDVCPLDEDISEGQLLRLAASAEARSEHPLAQAIAACAKERRVALAVADNFHMAPGKGVEADIEGQRLLCGNAGFIGERQIAVDEAANARLEPLRLQGKAVILVASGGRLVGAVALADTLRPGAGAMISELKEAGTEVVLLTGDHAQTAQHFAGMVDIRDVRADLLPAQKVEIIRKLQAEGRNVCMIGDGVNDAPALKAANVGVAMGTMGSDIAVEAADIALMGDDIGKIPYLKKLSTAAVKTIKLSIGLSLCINFVAVSLSIAGVLTPTTGALVHNAGSIFVVLIAALLYDRKFISTPAGGTGTKAVLQS